MRTVRPRSADYTTALTSDVSSVVRLGEFVPRAALRICLGLGAALVMFVFHVWLGVVACAATVVAYGLMVTVNRRVAARVSHSRESYGMAVRRAEEIASRSRMIAGLKAGPRLSAWFSASLRTSLEHDRAVIRTNSAHMSVQEALGGAALLGFAGVIWALTSRGALSVGEATTAMVLFPRLSDAIPWAAHVFVLLQPAREARRRLAALDTSNAASGPSSVRLFSDTPLIAPLFEGLLRARGSGDPGLAAALEAAHADEVLRRFEPAVARETRDPEGLVSGGQRQRLLLAHALWEMSGKQRRYGAGNGGGLLGAPEVESESGPDVPELRLHMIGALDSVDEPTRERITTALSAWERVVVTEVALPGGPGNLTGDVPDADATPADPAATWLEPSMRGEG
ncbi:hypothetical protein [Falsarthrobacter nasiphocae]|uniref:ABC-type multidrug transport system fused ATPase/permease subunit n=1 Tax=Falsarthrobacter nasiphocae TaxID=189863 RepID=A0AAE3YHR5_9MICC|nr:hypothetical protein [Falsarthrobacter nasiphocae]MDR6892527.1 ABC-type multidrug transport system fused ATPase/permease subunit [Falsarthrobacter nasiphocae]